MRPQWYAGDVIFVALIVVFLGIAGVCYGVVWYGW